MRRMQSEIPISSWDALLACAVGFCNLKVQDYSMPIISEPEHINIENFSTHATFVLGDSCITDDLFGSALHEVAYDHVEMLVMLAFCVSSRGI